MDWLRIKAKSKQKQKAKKPNQLHCRILQTACEIDCSNKSANVHTFTRKREQYPFDKTCLYTSSEW